MILKLPGAVRLFTATLSAATMLTPWAASARRARSPTISRSSRS